jgi:hypothetical protein
VVEYGLWENNEGIETLFAKKCKLHHLLLRRRQRTPQNVRDIDGDCSTRAIALRSFFLLCQNRAPCIHPFKA